MGIQVTVDLPSTLYRQAQQLARLTEREIEEVLISTLEMSLPIVLAEAEADIPVSSLSDADILAITELDVDQQRMRSLIDKQKANTLTPVEQFELQNLFRVSEISLRRRAQALTEAIKRGLHSPNE
jgi:hypothetical protein